MKLRAWAFAAAALAALAAGPIAAAASPPGHLQLKESLRQRVAHSGRGASRTATVVDKRKLAATFDMQVEPQASGTYDADTRVSFRLGSFLFDRLLGDDPAFNALQRKARIAVPGALPADPPAGFVSVRWTGRHLWVDVRAAAPAVLADVNAPLGKSWLSMHVDAAIRVGDGSWFYFGTARGKARVKQRTVDGAGQNLTKAKVALTGLSATLSDDRKPPTVTIDAPASHQFLGETPIVVSGRASDDRRIARVSWRLDTEEPVAAPWAVVPGTGGAVDERATFHIAVPVTVEGLHTVEVCVQDDAGNEDCATVSFVYSVSRPSLLAAGDRFSVAVHEGVTYAWGRGVSGQLGSGTFDSKEAPEAAAALAGAIAVSAGLTHTVALFSDGTVHTCGSNAYGQLGDGSRDDRPDVGPVPGLTDVVAVAAGNYHSVALRADGTVWIWGANGLGQIGDGTGGNFDNADDRLSPVQVPGLASVAAVSAGADATIVTLSDGTLRGWGDGHYGQVPAGLSPQAVAPSLGDVVEVAVGGVHVIARTADGSVWTWGYRLYGAIGDGTAGDAVQETPYRVAGIAGAIQVTASATSCSVLLASHTVVSWGGNEFGQCGTGSGGQQNSPRLISQFTDIVRVASSGQSVDVLAESAGKTLYGWGRYVTGDPLADAIATKPVPIALPSAE
jgi:alpha-tubulin suppressor-like RCC1 family protein